MSDLMVIGYPDEETAQKAWEELVKLERDFLVDLGAAAHEDLARGGPEGTYLGAASGLSRGAGPSDLIAAPHREP